VEFPAVPSRPIGLLSDAYREQIQSTWNRIPGLL
jgi:hypothetical protein